MSSFRWSFHRNTLYLHTFSVLTWMKVKTSVEATWSVLLKCSKRHQGSFKNPRGVYRQPHHLWIMVINVSEVFRSGRSTKSAGQSTYWSFKKAKSFSKNEINAIPEPASKRTGQVGCLGNSSKQRTRETNRLWSLPFWSLQRTSKRTWSGTQ